MNQLSDDEELLRMLRLPDENIIAANAALASSKAERAAAPKRRVAGQFVLAELETLKRAAKAVADMGSGALMVWLLLAYEARRKRTATVSISNLSCTEWGVSRGQKYRVLERFEAAGLIKVVRCNGASLKVRLILNL